MKIYNTKNMCVTAANSRVRGVAQWGISPACEKGGSQVTAVLTQKHIIHIKQKTANELISFSFFKYPFFISQNMSEIRLQNARKANPGQIICSRLCVSNIYKGLFFGCYPIVHI